MTNFKNVILSGVFLDEGEKNSAQDDILDLTIRSNAKTHYTFSLFFLGIWNAISASCTGFGE